MLNKLRWCARAFKEDHADVLEVVRSAADLEAARSALFHYVTECQFRIHGKRPEHTPWEMTVVRDCARVLRTMLTASSDSRAGFSVVRAIRDLAEGEDRPDLSPAFFGELSHLFNGLRGNPEGIDLGISSVEEVSGREAALVRSEELDHIWEGIEESMARYESGLEPEAMKRREERRRKVQEVFGATDSEWADWRWQVRNIIEDPQRLAQVAVLRDEEFSAVERAVQARQPFGVTPYYASLMADDPESGRDRAVRAQVIPPSSYVECMAAHSDRRAEFFDFMREADTSPVDLVTRRYPAIAILKPFNTCPQICVYCQRNWEIERAMAPGAMARKADLQRALDWIREHDAIKEVLVTGGDPLAMGDGPLERILRQVAEIPHVEMIRIGTRTPVTLPMRITPELSRIIASFREPGVRDVCLVTHVEHVSEVTRSPITPSRPRVRRRPRNTACPSPASSRNSTRRRAFSPERAVPTRRSTTCRALARTICARVRTATSSPSSPTVPASTNSIPGKRTSWNATRMWARTCPCWSIWNAWRGSERTQPSIQASGIISRRTF